MTLNRLSLQALEAFERVARAGSVRAAAHEMGLSMSSVSAHVSRLEAQLGVVLLDRSRRPFLPTRDGQEVLHHLTRGLDHLRRATGETALSGALGARSLRIGIVEDFEGSVAPELAVALAGRMPRARLSVSTVLSHAAPELLRNGDLDMAVVSTTDGTTDGVRSEPLLRDPFLLALPRGDVPSVDRLLSGETAVPFLRFNPDHLIGRQIEAHLARNRVVLPERFAFDSARSILAVVASGAGWAVVTALGVMRAQDYARGVALHPLPLPALARRIALLSRVDVDAAAVSAIAALFRQIAQRAVVEPFAMLAPELSTGFEVIDGPD